ncbi:MAG: TetR family transcriptional regulator [Bacillota bacterium]
MNKHQEIVKAAARVFREKGYHAATIQDIATEVGLLKGSLYHHIQGKEQLLMEVLVRAVRVLHEGLTRVAASGLAPEEKLKQAILFHLEAYLGREELPVFYNEIRYLSPESRGELNSVIKEYEDMWMKILKDGVDAKTFRDDLPQRIVLQAVFGMCNWANKWFRPDGKLSPAEIGEIFFKMAVEGLKKD